MTPVNLSITKIDITPLERGSKADVHIQIGGKSYTAMLIYQSAVTEATVKTELAQSAEKIQFLVALYQLDRPKAPGKKFTKEILIEGTTIKRTFVDKDNSEKTTTTEIRTFQAKIEEMTQKLEAEGARDEKVAAWTHKKELLTKVIATLSKSSPIARVISEPTPPPITRRLWIENGNAYGLPADTANVHKKEGQYTPERKALHQSIIQDIIGDLHPVSDEKPVAVILVGSPGSGDTLAREIKAKQIGVKVDYVQVGLSRIIEKIPEFQQAINLETREGKIVTAKNAIEICKNEGTDIMLQLKEKLTETAKYHILYDGTDQDATFCTTTIEKLKAQGYDVHLLMTDGVEEACIKRARKQADITGCFIEDQIVKQLYQKARDNFRSLSETADYAALFDTSTSSQKLVFEKKEGKKEVHDKAYCSRNGWNERLRLMTDEVVDDEEELFG